MRGRAVNLIGNGLEQVFDIDREGRIVFYPFGPISRARLIRDRATFDSVRAHYGIICTVMVFGVFGVALANRFVLSFEQALYGVAIVLSLSALWMHLLAMQLPFAGSSPSEPAETIRQPRDSVVGANSPEGFGRRRTPPGS
jgi:hypothetical protein